MASVDTNVLVRYLVQDDDSQFAAVTRLLEDRKASKVKDSSCSSPDSTLEPSLVQIARVGNPAAGRSTHRDTSPAQLASRNVSYQEFSMTNPVRTRPYTGCGAMVAVRFVGKGIGKGLDGLSRAIHHVRNSAHAAFFAWSGKKNEHIEEMRKIMGGIK